MPEKDPTNWTVATWALAVGMGLAGGLLNWYGRMSSRHPRAFSALEFVADGLAGSFVGVGAFMALDAMGVPYGLCGAGAGYAGRMSDRLLIFIWRWAHARAGLSPK